MNFNYYSFQFYKGDDCNYFHVITENEGEAKRLFGENGYHPRDIVKGQTIPVMSIEDLNTMGDRAFAGKGFISRNPVEKLEYSIGDYQSSTLKRIDMNKLSWVTTFDIPGRTMTHVFSDRVSAISDFRTREIRIFRDGTAIRRCSNDIPEETYTLLLVSIAEDAEKLKAFSPKEDIREESL